MKWLAFAAAFLGSPAPAPAQTQLPPVVRNVDLDERLGAPLPRDPVFTDESGARVRLGDYFGAKPLLLIPAYYTCPMLCGLVQHGLIEAVKQIDRRFGAEFAVVTISIDPHDTPATARVRQKDALQALNRPEAHAAWHFLVGDEKNIHAFTDAIGFSYAYDPRSKQFAHTAVIVVAAADGRITRYLYGVSPRPSDLRMALVEAGDGRVGTITDRLLLTCFHWDPATRRYGPFILGFFRIGSLGILLALGGVLLFLARRERRR